MFIERPDGSRLPVLVNFAALKNARGEIIGAITSFMDITKRKQAEEALREVGERCRFMAESMPQKIFTARPNGEVDYFNQQWTEFTGLSFKQIKDWGWTQFIHPNDVQENVRQWQHSIDTGEPFQFEHRFRRADGIYRWHLSRARAMRDAEGNALMWIGTNTDIDDQKRAEQVLRDSEAYFRELTQSMPSVVWTNLPDSHVDFVNSQWLEYTGQTLDYVRSDPEAWMSAVHPDDRERAVGIYLEGTRSGQDFTMEARFRRASDGAYRWHLNRSVPVRDAHGDLVKFLGTCTDIDDLKRAEAEREKLLNELQRERRHLEDSQEQLQDKIQDLEKFHDVVVGRELKMIEMEKEVKRLQEIIRLASVPKNSQ